MRYTVSDVMTKGAIVVRETTPFREIVEMMQRYGVSALPVLGDDERLVGIVSEADLLLKEEDPAASRESPLLEGRKHRLRRRKTTGLVAADVMSKPVKTISPRALLTDAAQLLDQLRVKRLVVTDAGRVLGIVSRRDLLKVFLRSDEEIADEISTEVLDPAALPASSDVRAHVRDGVVTLEGEVELRSLESILVQLVRRVDGVVDVEDHLSFRMDDRLSAT